MPLKLEDILGHLGGRLGGLATSPFHGDFRLQAFSPFTPGGTAGSPFKGGGLRADSPFAGKTLAADSPFRGSFGTQGSPFRGATFGAQGSIFNNPLGGLNIPNPYAPVPSDPATRAAGATGASGTASTGLAPGVAQWADKTRATFGDMGADMPDIMLAIMTNESGGKVDAYNPAAPGGAWGLFQLVGQVSSFDVDGQFAAAKKLAQDKLSGIARSYAAHGLNPDARTRARDFALAWAGHFDYDTGLPNSQSRDIGSGQTAAQLSEIFLRNYDNIKAGRSQGTTNSGLGGGSGWSNSITPGTPGQIMQEFGPTDYSAAHPDTYAYGNAYGLTGSQHPGVDWAVGMNTRTTTPVTGTVFIVGNDHGTGYFYKNTMSASNPDTSGEFAIRLDNGDILILGHMSNITVRVGQRLNAGDFIGYSGGSDGAHIHVEYRKVDRTTGSGYRIVDPRQYIR